MVDIVVNDRDVVTVVETPAGEAIVTTVSSTDIVSTTTTEVVVTEQVVDSVVTVAQSDTVVTESTAVVIVTESGPQGPPGAQGPAGPAGPAGADGTNYLTLEQAADLTDGGDTTLHTHTSKEDVGVAAGLVATHEATFDHSGAAAVAAHEAAPDPHPQYMLESTYDADANGVVDRAENVVIRVRNNTGVTVSKGAAVYISGAIGQRPTITLARADAEATSSKTLGLMEADLANNGDGFAIVIGRLAGLDTSMFNDGDPLWLSATTAGGIVNSPPADPNHTVFIGYCAYSQNNNGVLVVNIQNGYEINELHDVVITTPTDGDAVVYEAASGLFKNKGIIATHEAALDPHPQYLTATEGDAAYAALGHSHSGVYEPVITKATGYATWNGSAWVFVNETYSLSGHTHAFADLTSKPTTLAGYGITDAASSTHNHAVDSLSDVVITANSDNEVLAWDSTTSKWINQTAAEAGLATAAQGANGDTAYSWGNHALAGYITSVSAHTLGSHSDVTITSIAAGEILKWNGSAWVNNTLAEAGIAAAADVGQRFGETMLSLSGNATVTATGIPSWATKIVISLAGVSISTTASIYSRLGDSGGVESTGYTENSVDTGGATGGANTTYFCVIPSVLAADTVSGEQHISLNYPAGNRYASTWQGYCSSSLRLCYGAGQKVLTGTLDRVLIGTTVGTFDAGTATIYWEE